MSDAQSKIDSLQELNSQLIATIAELRKENAKVKAENTKLKQDKEEIEARIVGLEQTTKENAELKARVAKLEQKQSQNNISSDTRPSNSSPISPEDKEVDDFVDLKVKERVSNEIRDRNREKKLQCESAGNQAQDLLQFHEITSRDMELRPQVNH